MEYCPGCGAEVEGIEPYCEECGLEWGTEEERREYLEEEESQDPEGEKVAYWMATVVGSIWVLMGFALLTETVLGGILTIVVGFVTIPKTREELGLRERS